MKAFWNLMIAEVKLYLREPVAAFFTIAYAPMMLILFGMIYGNKPEAIFGGLGTMDISVPSYIGLIIVTVGLISVPIDTATNRDKGILRRFRATPLHPEIYLAADVTGNYLMTLIGVLLLVVIGKLAYHIHFSGNWLSVFLGFTLSALAFYALGYLLAALAPTARIAQTVGMVLAFPMMFISGATIPIEVLPHGVRQAANFIPLTHVVTLMRGLWFGDPWSAHLIEVTILVGTLVVSSLLAAHLFRWE